MPARKPAEKQIDVSVPTQATVDLCILGTEPFLCNRMSQKAKQEILAPVPKTRATKAQTLKCNPPEDYRNSPYTLPDPDAPTLLAFLACGFKGAMKTAALDTPGAQKTQIGRLIRVEGERLPLWGVPQMSMMVAREQSANRTPRITTRAILPQWAMRVQITFPETIIKPKSVINLLSIGGMFAGVGDGRTEKGWANYGSFEVVNEDDERFQAVLESGGRAAQQEALDNPTFYDDETESLLAYWYEQARARGFDVAA